MLSMRGGVGWGGDRGLDVIIHWPKQVKEICNTDVRRTSPPHGPLSAKPGL